MRAMLLGIYFLVLGLAVSSRAQTFGEITGEIMDRLPIPEKSAEIAS
jgi:hypothetical protein